MTIEGSQQVRPPPLGRQRAEDVLPEGGCIGRQVVGQFGVLGVGPDTLDWVEFGRVTGQPVEGYLVSEQSCQLDLRICPLDRTFRWPPVVG
jgi:hypothetical protein